MSTALASMVLGLLFMGLALTAFARIRTPSPLPTEVEVRVEAILDYLVDPGFHSFVDDDLVIDRAVDPLRIHRHGRTCRVIGWSVAIGTARAERVISLVRMRSILLDHFSGRSS